MFSPDHLGLSDDRCRGRNGAQRRSRRQAAIGVVFAATLSVGLWFLIIWAAVSLLAAGGGS